MWVKQDDTCTDLSTWEAGREQLTTRLYFTGVKKLEWPGSPDCVSLNFKNFVIYVLDIMKLLRKEDGSMSWYGKIFQEKPLNAKSEMQKHCVW